MMKMRWIGMFVTLTSLAGACNWEEGTAPESEIEQRQVAIVNGTAESGYASVGALRGAAAAGDIDLCTGTVIGDNWVLTAAQCVDGVAPAELEFLTGADVSNPDGRYPVVQTFSHPSFDPEFASGDIAVAYVDGLTDADASPYNCTYLDSSYLGKNVMKVGYGVSSAELGSGEGIKRWAGLEISAVESHFLTYDWAGSGPCVGDSGAPGFLEVGGEERVVGVTSQYTASCDGVSVDTRVDSHCSWINSLLGDGAPTKCDVLAGDCDGETCVPVSDTAAYCVESAGKGPGEACDASDADWSDGLPCADGLVCAAADNGDEACRAYCTSDADCADQEVCTSPIFGVASVGACLPCTDADADGYCADVDCDDGDPAVNSGASEDCTDGIDNDCDGAIDDEDGECGGADAGLHDAGVDAGDDVGADAGSSGEDVGVADGAGTSSEGCSCSSTSPAAPVSTGAVLLVILAAARWRRRAR